MSTNSGSVLGGALLVAGTAIGGGMLALPVLTATGGFIPAVMIYVLCWMFMTCTGLLLLETYLWTDKEVNLVSMAQMTLGLPGRIVAWVLYIFLFYSLTTAYIAGGGQLVVDLFNGRLPSWAGPLIFTCIFAPFVYFGAYIVDRLNSILMTGLLLSFFLFVLFGIPHIDVQLLNYKNWFSAFFATPVVFTSFGFQGLVPTLTKYLERDSKRVKKAIIIGSTIPLCIYILWEALILGIIPMPALETARSLGLSAVAPLKEMLNKPWLYSIGEFFAFFAIVTSFLGVTLALLDFLADGLKIRKTSSSKLGLCFLIFLPPLIFAMSNTCIFLDTLHYAGGFGCALLLGLLPILMVWRGRYTLGYNSLYRLSGGRFTLSVLLLFIIAELVLTLVKIG